MRNKLSLVISQTISGILLQYSITLIMKISFINSNGLKLPRIPLSQAFTLMLQYSLLLKYSSYNSVLRRVY